jgi:hypothetical protein
MRFPAVAALPNEPGGLKPFYSSDYRSAADTYEMSNAVKTGIALPSPAIEAVNNRHRHALVGTRQAFIQTDRLECESRV